MPIVPRETSSGKALGQALLKLQPDLPAALVATLETHFELLIAWNRTHNLTRIVDPVHAASVHYLDSLLPLLKLPAPEVVADLGSGTGLPGVAAAALWPEARALLLEAVAKKCSFLRAVRASLGHLRLEVVMGRVENLPPVSAGLVLTRASFPWPQVAPLLARHLAPRGLGLVFLGREVPSDAQWAEQVAAAGLLCPSLSPYTLPPEAAERHCATARAPGQ